MEEALAVRRTRPIQGLQLASHMEPSPLRRVISCVCTLVALVQAGAGGRGSVVLAVEPALC